MPPFKINPLAFEVKENGLRFFAAQRTTVLLGQDVATAVPQLCQIIFDKRLGSIFVQFPYFPDTPGILSRAQVRVGPEGGSTVDLKEGGAVSSHRVKYSHPPDGNAHFSQDGKVLSTVRKPSLPLMGNTGGHVFELHAYNISQFKLLRGGEERPGRLYLPFKLGNAPQAATVVAEWRDKESLREYAREIGRELQTIDDVPRRIDGALYRAVLLGQPAGFPLQDHLLLINVMPIPSLHMVKGPTMLFMGGWDYPWTQPQVGSELGFLTFMYPSSAAEDLKAAIGSIDYSPKVPTG